MILLDPVTLEPANDPTNVLLFPLLPLLNPIKVFKTPDVNPSPDLAPKRVLLLPVVSVFPAAYPIIILLKEDVCIAFPDKLPTTVF
jgi:hypothetical protein